MKVIVLLHTAVFEERRVVGGQARGIAQAGNIDGFFAFGPHEDGQFDLLIAKTEYGFFRHGHVPMNIFHTR